MSLPAVDSAVQGSSHQGAPFGLRIDGWKEIATYLGRSERTVKRWEVDRGLPIHRLPGAGSASVHAYKGELDAWLISIARQAADVPETAPKDLLSDTSPADPLAVASLQTSVANSNRPIPLLLALALSLFAISVWIFHSLRAERRSPASVSASEKAISHDLYLKGRYEWNKRTPQSLNVALNDFTQSIVHDPNNAYAYSGLADTYVLLNEYSPVRNREGFAPGIAAARKAVELDGSLAEAHRSLGFAEIWGNWDFRDGERELLRAIKLNPRDPLAHLWLATSFKAPEWYSVDEHEFQLAQELDPASTITVTNKSIWLFENGKTQAGLDLAREAERSDPNFVAPHRYLALMYWEQHDYNDFLAETRKVEDLQRDDASRKVTDSAAEAFRSAGELGLLRALYAARSLPDEDGVVAGIRSVGICIRLHKTDEAFRLLHDDYTHRRSQFLSLLTDPDLLAFRGDPRYQDLRRLIDYPEPPSNLADLY